MRTKQREYLTGCCLLVAALGLQPALGQEQTQKPAGESQTAEDIHLTREMINNERQALVTKAMDQPPARCSASGPSTSSTGREGRRRLGSERGPAHHLC